VLNICALKSVVELYRAFRRPSASRAFVTASATLVASELFASGCGGAHAAPSSAPSRGPWITARRVVGRTAAASLGGIIMGEGWACAAVSSGAGVDTVFYSADGDPISLFFKWMDSMIMRMALGYFILPKLGKIDRQHIANGGSVGFKLDSAEFIKWRHGTLLKACVDRNKKEACRFTIRRWDQNSKKFDEDVYLWFDEKTAHRLLNAHGGFWCYFAKNDFMGNWLKYQYHWPPEDPKDLRLKVVVKRTGLVNAASYPVECSEHDSRCKYRQDDGSGKLSEWSEFSIPKPKE